MTDITPQQEVKFYTTGFAGKDINDLKPLIDQLNAVLVDVRFSPTSDFMRWRQVYLKTLLRGKYRHVAQLGSRTSRADASQIHHLDLGLKVLLSFGTNAVLMCECADLQDCHRRIVADELRRKGYTAEELSDWKSNSLVT